MGIRKRSKSPAKRTAILTAAADLFLELGLEATSMDKVARKAGVSKQTVYSHFSNKEALFSAVIEHKCELYGLSADLFESDRSCRDNLLAYGRQLCDMLCTEEVVRMDRLVSSHAAERPDLALLYYKSGPRQVKDVLQNYLAVQAGEGILKIPNVDLAASLLLHAFQADEIHLVRWGVNQQNRQDTREYLEVAVDMFMEYYRPPG